MSLSGGDRIQLEAFSRDGEDECAVKNVVAGAGSVSDYGVVAKRLVRGLAVSVSQLKRQGDRVILPAGDDPQHGTAASRSVSAASSLETDSSVKGSPRSRCMMRTAT